MSRLTTRRAARRTVSHRLSPGQLAFMLADPPARRPLPDFDGTCPRCGAPEFVFACGRRCRCCGFKAACDD